VIPPRPSLRDLVLRDAAGRIDGVRYDELAPMLLNEAQEQKRTADAQTAVIAVQVAQLSDVQQQLSPMQATLTKLQAKDELAAQR
jgi:hypothetical protein